MVRPENNTKKQLSKLPTEVKVLTCDIVLLGRCFNAHECQMAKIPSRAQKLINFYTNIPYVY